MKYARDARAAVPSEQTVQLLFEALPWIKNLTGKTVVIKYGGAAMVDKRLRADVMADILLLKIIGMKPVLVHGGGSAISEALERCDLPVSFKDGQRVTTPAAMEIVREVLVGKVNQELVSVINEHGNIAVGVSGCDAGVIVAEQLDPELGRVGKIVSVNAEYLEEMISHEYIPVIASVAQGEDGGFYNINADVAAGYIAAAVHAHDVVFLTDVNGLFEDFSDRASLISNLTLEETQRLLDGGKVAKGMIPKLESCIYALRCGVFRSHIINGTIDHALLLELLTDSGVGTVMHSTDAGYEMDAHPHPLGTFASRLAENIDPAAEAVEKI
ncbi:N-acetylglutamate kinase [Coriobacterium glomerans PW2]|uniref:Acetylglutamate kinase n=1 Tax=Coriobacterium glomerans (strain ATCC 49209 / DSM 20642 / JCM 10262 / PW2) TaxID=700015 RepID=F2NAQ5_CORGP|nr:acetylglutamate kinase [Coriobacterium glomerans]AEB07511.1 N-acetylglutamate kinase [Coriobacterium glomerans PW2]